MKLKFLSFALASMLCGFGAAPAQAQSANADDFPNRAMRIVVPYPPGGINDNVARIVGQKLSESYKQPVIIENRAGGGTIIGTDFVAKAPADGYIILLSSTANTVNVSLRPNLPYDPMKAFTHVSLALTTPYVMVVNSNVPARTFKEVIALAKSKPQGITYASAGNGSGSHLFGEMLAQAAKIKMLHVAYKGMGPAVTDLLGGQVEALFGSYSSLAAHVKSGRLRVLAVTGAQRIAAQPDVPTIAESGFPDYAAEFWVGFSAPAGTPQPIVNKLSRDIGVIMRSAEVRQRFSPDAAVVVGSTPEEAAKYFAADVARWTKVIRDGNIKP